MGAGHPRLAPQFFPSMKAILKVNYGSLNLLPGTPAQNMLISIVVLPFQKLFILL
jgi:hypothetical protein